MTFVYSDCVSLDRPSVSSSSSSIVGLDGVVDCKEAKDGKESKDGKDAKDGKDSKKPKKKAVAKKVKKPASVAAVPPPPDINFIAELASVARMYELDVLYDRCMNGLTSCITANNCVAQFQLACKYAFAELKAVVFQFLAINMQLLSDVLATQEYGKLPRNETEALLTILSIKGSISVGDKRKRAGVEENSSSAKRQRT
jgi:hypothetical protein